MHVSSYISPKAIKGQPSAIQDVAWWRWPDPAGEVVAIKGGHIVDTATLNSLPERLRESDVQIADGFHLAALLDDEFEPVMLFLNHSCEPNVGFAGNIVLVAMRDVAAGEELTTDYALFDDHDRDGMSAGQVLCARRRMSIRCGGDNFDAAAAALSSCRAAACTGSPPEASPPGCSWIVVPGGIEDYFRHGQQRLRRRADSGDGAALLKQQQ